MISSSGPRSELPVSTFAGECREKLALAASKSGLPGAGMAHCSYSASDPSGGSALPNAYRACSAVRETARLALAGFLKTGSSLYRTR